ncbi:MAG: phosphoglucosamine mutase [Blastochloris sp.]|nr:phosphoglucosamine mutase [Blastochloris sp.]
MSGTGKRTRRWFGTDGIRGAYGQEPMTEAFVYRCGRAAADFFGRSHASPLLVVGRDTRESGLSLERALCQGLREGGAQVRCLGVLPTAAVSLLTLRWKASAGIMISASHNEFSDNGIKFFGPEGFKLGDEMELALEQRIEAVEWSELSEFPGSEVRAGMEYELQEEAFRVYAEVLRGSLDEGLNLKGMKIWVDAAHGAAWQTTPRMLRELGAELELLGAEPDGRNINASCGSLHPELVQKRIREAGQAGGIGICHDGDADRVVMVDDGMRSHWMGMKCWRWWGLDAVGRGKLSGNAVVATVMSNLGLDEAFRAQGAEVRRTAVGDRYVLEAMKEGGHGLGGEQSGHMLFLEHLPTGDGLLTALQVIQVMKRQGRELRELRKVLKKYPQKLFNVKVKEKVPFEQIPGLSEVVAEVEAEMGELGVWCCVIPGRKTSCDC